MVSRKKTPKPSLALGLNEGIRKILPLTLLIIIGFFFNLSLFLKSYPTSPLQQNLMQISQYPFIPKSHLQLARLYLAEQNLTAASDQLTITENLLQLDNRLANVLGVASDLEILKAQVAQTPQKIQRQLQFWEKIHLQYPNYPDALVQLAYLNYNQGKLALAKSYLDQALKLDYLLVYSLPQELLRL